MADNVVEMQRKITASVNRFGQVFKIEYRAGVSPKSSDIQAALYVNGSLLAITPVVYHDIKDWGTIFFDLTEDHALLSYSMLGMPSAGGNLNDTQFMEDAEIYLLQLLRAGLAARLVDTSGEESEEEEPKESILSPHERGQRAATVWHNHGKNEAELPTLIAIEIFDALDEMGFGLGAMLDDEELPREECGNAVRGVVAEALEGWQ